MKMSGTTLCMTHEERRNVCINAKISRNLNPDDFPLWGEEIKRALKWAKEYTRDGKRYIEAARECNTPARRAELLRSAAWNRQNALAYYHEIAIDICAENYGAKGIRWEAQY